MFMSMRSGRSNLALATLASPSPASMDVEDQENLRGVLRDVLTGSGYTVRPEGQHGPFRVPPDNTAPPKVPCYTAHEAHEAHERD